MHSVVLHRISSHHINPRCITLYHMEVHVFAHALSVWSSHWMKPSCSTLHYPAPVLRDLCRQRPGGAAGGRLDANPAPPHPDLRAGYASMERASVIDADECVVSRRVMIIGMAWHGMARRGEARQDKDWRSIGIALA